MQTSEAADRIRCIVHREEEPEMALPVPWARIARRHKRWWRTVAVTSAAIYGYHLEEDADAS